MNQKADPSDIAKKNAVALYAKYKDLQVIDEASYATAGAGLVQIKAMRKDIKSKLKPFIDKAKEVYDHHRGQFKKYDNPLLGLEGLIKGRLATFADEQEKKRRQLEAELQEKARQEAEDAKVNEAKKLEEMGETEAAEAVIEEEVHVAPVTVDNKPKAQGVSTRKKWHAEVVDLSALIKAVAEGKEAESFLLPDMKVLNKMAGALMEELNIAGVKAVSETIVSARSE